MVRLQMSLKSPRLRSRDAVLYSVHVADGCTARLGTALRAPVRRNGGRDRRLYVLFRKMVPMKQVYSSRSVKSMALRASMSRELARMMFALRDGVQGETDVLLKGPECSCTKGALVGGEARVGDPRLVRGGQDLSWQMRITPVSREREMQ